MAGRNSGRACRWVNGGGVQLFASGLAAGGVSANGRVFSINASPDAIRWEGGQSQTVGATASYWDVVLSGDGATVAYNEGPTSSLRASFWTSGTGARQLPLGGFLRNYARGISHDGAVIVGEATDSQGHVHAVRWLNGVVLDVLDTPAGFDEAYAAAVSGDGSTVACTLHVAGLPIGLGKAFRWSSTLGSSLLPNRLDLPYSSGHGVSFDGSMITGACSDGYSAGRPAVWVGTSSPRLLTEILAHAGFVTPSLMLNNGSPTRVSYDGQHFAGGSNDCVWYATLPLGTLCYANCDLSTTPPYLSVSDFGCFLNQFASGGTYANCDQSTTPPVLNINDFVCFLNRFAAGCP